MVVVVWLLCPTLCDPMTVVHQLPLPMGFPKQKYWSGMPLPSPGDLPKPGFKLASLALAGRFFTTEPPGKSIFNNKLLQLLCIFELNKVTQNQILLFFY